MKKLLLFLVSMSCATLWGQTADFTASPTTICVGGSVQFNDGSTGATSWSWTFIDGGSGQSSSIPNPLITYNIAGTYSVILTISNGISSDTEIKTNFIQVVNSASINLTSGAGTENQNVCEGFSFPSPITYSVIGASGVSFTGFPPGVSGSFVPNSGGCAVTINGTPTVPGLYNYSITTTGSNCAPVTVFGTINVDQSPLLTLTSGSGTDNPTVCLNTAISPITFSIGGSATGATATGLPAGVSANFSAGTLTISGSPSTSGTFPYSVTTTGGTCPPISLTGTITVDPLPTLTLSSSIGSDNQVVCQNTAINILTYTLGGGATNASVSGLPVGLSASVSSGILTISGTPTVPGSYTMTITSIGGSCPAVSTTASLQVDAAPTATLFSAVGTDAQSVCINTAINSIIYTIGGSATGATVSGLPSGVSGNFSAGQLTISGTPTSSGLFNYTVTTTGGGCPPVSTTGSIQVDALPTISLTSTIGSDNQTICAATALNSLSYAMGGSATGASITGLPGGINMTVSSGNITISGTPLTAGVFPYTITSSGGSCAATTVNGTITVDAIPTITLTSPIGSDNQSVCIGSAISSITYSISPSATGGSIIGLPSGITGSFAAGTFTISGTPTVSGNFSYTLSSTGGTCAAIAQNGNIQIDALPTLTLISAVGTDNQTVCANSAILSIDYLIGGSATGANVTGLPSGIVATISNDTLLISGASATPGTYNFTVTSTGGACAFTQVSGSIIIDPAPILTLVSPGSTQNQTACLNSPIQTIDISVGGSATGAIATGLPSGVTTSFSSGILTISGSATQTGSFPIVVTSTGGSCVADTMNCTIMVQSPSITLSSAPFTNNQNICENTSLTPIQYIVSGPIVANNLPLGISGVYTPGVPDTYTISGVATSTGSFQYTLSTTGLCGSNLIIGTITVAPTLTGNTSGTNLTVCEESQFTLLGSSMPNSNIVNYNYEWEYGTSAAGPFTQAPGVNYEEFYTGQISLGDPNVYFRRIVSTGTCADTAIASLITLDTLPSISNSTYNFTICSNDSLVLNQAIVSNGAISNWSWNGNGQLLNTSSQTPTFVPSISDQGQTAQISYDVFSNNTCAPNFVTGNYFITVLEDPMANAGGSATICANGTSVNIAGASALNGTATWSHNGTGFLSDTLSMSPQYHANLGDTNSIVVIELVVTSTACATPLTDTAHFMINVLPFGIQPSINAFAGSDQTISIGNSIDLAASGVAITTWNWTPSLGLSDSTVSNPTANPVVTTDYILTVTDINGCMDQDTLRIIVNSDFSVFVPNLFSPNGDGFNDTWEIPELINYPNTAVTIINREGREIYKTADYDNSWDGTYEGKKLPEATYYYLIEFANSDTIYKGAVTILRNKQ